MQVVDMQTNDATRACFLSHDPQVYYNPNAEPLKINDYVDFDNIAQTTRSVKKIDKDFQEHTIIQKKQNNIDRDTFVQIKQKLDPNYRPRQPRERIITVPEQLNEIEKKIRDYIKEELQEVELVTVKDINFRIQKSVYIANLKRSVFDEINRTLKEIQQMYENNDSILLIPVSTDEVKAMKIIGQNVDIDLILGNRNTLFF